MAFRDYYKILGVTRQANEDEIKKAFHRLAHKFHPDKDGGDASKFKEINEAYQVLSSKEKRAQYDRFGRVFSAQGGPASGGEGAPFGTGFGFSAGSGPASGWEFGFDPRAFEDMTDMGEIFDAFFEGMGLRQKRKTYERGNDLEAKIEIALEDAFRGISKTLHFERFLNCSHCAGLGYFPKEGVTACQTCSGQGEIRELRRGFFGSFTQIKSCERCFATGQIPNKVCSDCRGAGRLRKTERVDFEIAPGVESGQIIKIVGAGDAGQRGGAKGDLYVLIKIKAHPVFDRKGSDLFVKKEVNILNVLLGKKIDIQTIGGNILNFEIAPDTDLERPIRIPNEGLPIFNSTRRGDLYVKLIIKQPKKLSTKAKKLLDDLKRELE